MEVSRSVERPVRIAKELARQVFQTEAREVRKKNSAPALPMPVAPSNAAIGGLESVKKELRGLAAMLAAPVQPAPRSPTTKRIKDRKPGNLFEF